MIESSVYYPPFRLGTQSSSTIKLSLINASLAASPHAHINYEVVVQLFTPKVPESLTWGTRTKLLLGIIPAHILE